MYLQFRTKAPLKQVGSIMSFFLPRLLMKLIDTWNLYPLGATQRNGNSAWLNDFKRWGSFYFILFYFLIKQNQACVLIRTSEVKLPCAPLEGCVTQSPWLVGIRGHTVAGGSSDNGWRAFKIVVKVRGHSGPDPGCFSPGERVTMAQLVWSFCTIPKR